MSDMQMSIDYNWSDVYIYVWKIEFSLIYAKKYSKLSVTKYLRSETNLYLNSISLLVFIKICLHKYPLPLESILQMYVYLEVYVHTNKIEIVCFCHKYAFFFFIQTCYLFINDISPIAIKIKISQSDIAIGSYLILYPLRDGLIRSNVSCNAELYLLFKLFVYIYHWSLRFEKLYLISHIKLLKIVIQDKMRRSNIFLQKIISNFYKYLIYFKFRYFHFALYL